MAAVDFRAAIFCAVRTFLPPQDGGCSVTTSDMKLNSMQDLLVAELQDLLGAEKQLAQALPKMGKAIAHSQLRDEVEKHARETAQHEQRLERCFQSLGVTPQPARSHGMVGLISAWMELEEAEAQEDVRDAAIISSLQHIEHYEIAGYGCARAFAQVLDETEVAELLEKTLREEEGCDRRLSALAERFVNSEAESHSR